MAFARLVGLYACRVKRLRTEKRKPAYFIGFIGLIASALAFALCGLSCVVAWVALLLLFVGFSWVVGCVVGVSLSLRTI